MASPDTSFFAEAACKGKDSAIFFPDYPSHNFRKNVANTKAICAECSVQEKCRDYALEYEPLGIWGGMTEKERRQYRLDHNIKLLEKRGARIW